MSKWFLKSRASVEPKLRIFLFPYAGASAHIFNDWHQYFQTDIDVFSVQSPGRAERFGEEPITNLSEMTNQLLSEITNYIDIPYIFIGHSNGAFIAFDLSQKLQASENSNLKHLILSGISSPQQKPEFFISNLRKKEIDMMLERYSKIPSLIKNNENILNAFMPLILADFGLTDGYQFDFTKKIKTNLSLFIGKLDIPYHPEIRPFPWARLIEGSTSIFHFESGHFFIDDERDLFISRVQQLVTKELETLF
jgi:medium-chain acyl-[acyl-carrier-protein] hydrolase